MAGENNKALKNLQKYFGRIKAPNVQIIDTDVQMLDGHLKATKSYYIQEIIEALNRKRLIIQHLKNELT